MRRSRGRRGRELIARAGVATAAALTVVTPAPADHDRGQVEGFAVSQQQPVQVVLADGSVAEGDFRSDLHVLRDGSARGSAHLEYTPPGAAEVARTEKVDLAYRSARVSSSSDGGVLIEGTATSNGCGASGTLCSVPFTLDVPQGLGHTGDDLIYDIVGPSGSDVTTQAVGHTIGLRHEHTRPR